MSNSYPTRARAAPLNHSVYEMFLSQLGLNDSDANSLLKRGLNNQQLKTARYGSKTHHQSNQTLTAIGKVAKEFVLDGVPGFYTDAKGHWDCAKIQGIYIPVRDMIGHISSILIRNANPKDNKGKTENKYMAFSSAGKPKGGKVWQTTHCPIVKGLAKDVCGTEVRITEGVLKADVATALDDIYCLGIQGLKIHSDLEVILNELEVSVVRICLDAGEDDNVDIVRCKTDLINLVKKIGLDCIIESWDAKFGKGIDDVLSSGNKDKIIQLGEGDVEKFLEKANRKNPNNGEWLYVISAERFINTRTQQELKKSQFVDKFGLVETEVVNNMLAAGFPQVDGLTFWPAKDRIVVEENGLEHYNTWIDPLIEPEEGDVSQFLEHMEYLVENEAERNVLLDFMAHNIQFPGRKILWAVLFQGNQGVGKSYIAHVMKVLMGQHNVSSPTNEEIHEIYTAWQKHAALIVVEEIMARGRLELMNKLKPIITQDTTQIREMHKNAYKQPNRFNLLMFTNHDDPLILDEDDRRYFVTKSKAKLREIGYYEKLWDWTREATTVKALMHWMLRRDLSGFKANGKAPDTQAKTDLIDISRAPLEEWINNHMKEENWPFAHDLVAIRHLKNNQVCPHGLERLSDYKWAQALKACGAVPYPTQVKLSDGSKKVIWVLRRKDTYLAEQPDLIKQQYEKHLTNKEPGGNPLLDMKPM